MGHTHSHVPAAVRQEGCGPVHPGRGHLLPGQQLGGVRRLAPRSRPVGLLLLPQPVNGSQPAAVVRRPRSLRRRGAGLAVFWLGDACLKINEGFTKKKKKKKKKGIKKKKKKKKKKS